MLAYFVHSGRLRVRLAPMLYEDDDKDAAEALRESPVARAQRSPAALAKSATGSPPKNGAPVRSFQTLLADLATLTRNTVVTASAPDRPFTILTRPTPIQQKAFDLLGFPIACIPVATALKPLAVSEINGLRFESIRSSD